MNAFAGHLETMLIKILFFKVNLSTTTFLSMIIASVCLYKILILYHIKLASIYLT